MPASFHIHQNPSRSFPPISYRNTDGFESIYSRNNNHKQYRDINYFGIFLTTLLLLLLLFYFILITTPGNAIELTNIINK